MAAHPRFLIERELFDDLKAYLNNRKNLIKHTLLFGLSMVKQDVNPTLYMPKENEISLDEALKIFDSQCHTIPDQDLKSFQFDSLTETLSKSIWSYIQILEGMSVELFEETNMINADKWNQDLYERVEATKCLLFQELGDIKGFIYKLEKVLKELGSRALSKGKLNVFKRLRFKIHSALDPDLLSHIKKSEIFLHAKFKEFSKAVKFFDAAFPKVDMQMARFEGYAGFHNLDSSKSSVFLRLYKLLRVGELARGEDKKIQEEIHRSIKQTFPPGKTTQVFRDYFNILKRSLFDLSRLWRGQTEVAAQAIISSYRSEISSLISVEKKYRDFLLKMDGASYMRAGSGFTGWFLGPEPKRTKDISELIAETEKLDNNFSQLQNHHDDIDEQDPNVTLGHFNLIEKLIHDMGQPLQSRSIIKSKSDEIVRQLILINELTSPLKEVSGRIQDVLIRIMRVDTHFLTLQENRDFFTVYEIHQGLNPPSNNPMHTKRLKLYHQIIDHFKSGHPDHHEVEHDLQEAIQEFYHSITPGIDVKDYKNQLLEERYIFADFFYYLKQLGAEGSHIRHEFHIVDQYFEAVELKLESLQQGL
jgi:hypothetical protein